MSAIIEADILTHTTGYIIQQVNCQNVMGAGVAKALAHAYPQAKRAYHQLCSQIPAPTARFGTRQWVQVTDSLIAWNIFSQLTYGRGGVHTDENVLVAAIVEICASTSVSVAIPYGIGAGLGGGNWQSIYARIHHIPNLLIYRKG